MFKIILVLVLSVSSFIAFGQVPDYLKNYAPQYFENPREANRQWFKDARFGMFIHYGLYSQLGRGEWVQLRDTIP
ncbi:MAG: alpha-L-fucosidase, partial [Mariniphaga sp.]|nr:alpha-L-fucosidase [Mariniphaga sp.]